MSSRRLVYLIRRMVSFRGYPAVRFVLFENALWRRALRFDPWIRTQVVRHLSEEILGSFGCVAAERRVKFEPHQPVRREARAEGAEVVETAEEQAGANQQQKRERHLCNHESLPQPSVYAAHYRPCLIL